MINKFVERVFTFLPQKDALKGIITNAAHKYEETDGEPSKRASAAIAQASIDMLEGTHIGNEIKQNPAYQKNREKLEAELAQAIEAAIKSQLAGL